MSVKQHKCVDEELQRDVKLQETSAKGNNEGISARSVTPGS